MQLCRMQKKVNIAIFASGAGSNAEKIIQHFENNPAIQVKLVVSNKKEAGVLTIAAAYQIPTLMIQRSLFNETDDYIHLLKEAQIDLIILAGFLWKVPSNLVAAFQGRIINIHPALLPKFGGKGMYGHFVHEAVIESGDTESGISIHLVDDHYDHGRTLFQATCLVEAGDDADKLAGKIHQLEHAHFSEVIEQYIIEHPELFSNGSFL